MCGILGILKSKSTMDPNEFRKMALALSKLQRHRGTDWSGVFYDESNGEKNILVHERLAIVDPSGGEQPLTNEDKTLILCVNGEIYNHKDFRKEFSDYPFKTGSDCEPILPLYQKFGAVKTASLLDGMFSFILLDLKNNTFMAARDPIGVTSFYYGTNSKDGSIWFSSEMKAIKQNCDKFQVFPPGHVYTPEKGLEKYYEPVWRNPNYIGDKDVDYSLIKSSFEKAVIKRLMTDVPFGVLLSGGLDSSLVASIACRYNSKRLEDNFETPSWYPRIHSYSIGLKDSPDLKAAQSVAKFLNTAHHELTFTVQEGLDALQDVIWHLETFDVTTIRASTPMYLLSRKIKSFGTKMVLSGEGSDEILGGYLYFHNAPSSDEFFKETVRRVDNLHLSDNLRANKSTMAWGVEARVPFLDKEFLDVIMTIDCKHKIHEKDRIEKYILRKAFDTPESPYLPKEVLWRQKEQFSDGVGFSWIDTLKEEAEKRVSNEEFSQAEKKFPINPPQTKEAYWYRTMFVEMFPEDESAKTVMSWVPTWGTSKDPSGRAQKVHLQTNLN